MSMRILGVVLVIAFTRLVCLGQILIVNFNGGSGSGGPNVLQLNGTAMPDGNDVEIGYFTTGTGAGSDFQNDKNNLSALANLYFGGTWQQFGATNINSAGLIGPGGFAGANQRNDTTSVPTAVSFFNHPIDLWVFQTTDNKGPAAGFANVIAYGLFTSTVNASFSHTWIFPPPGSPNPTDDSINTLDITANGQNLANNILYGSFVPGGAGNPGGLEVAAVPEPSTLALFGLGLACVASMVRRVRSGSN